MWVFRDIYRRDPDRRAMGLKRVPLPVNLPGVPLGRVPTVTIRGGEVIFRTTVNVEGAIWTMVFTFSTVYAFRYLEEDHIDVSEFLYGVAEVEDSEWVRKLGDDWVKRYKSQPGRAFGGEPGAVRHYRIVYLENGMYEVVCKNMKLEAFPPA